MKMISHQIENINKDIQTIKRNQIEILELKSSIEMKNPLEGLNGRFKEAGGQISKYEDRSIELIQSDRKKKK